MPFAITPHLTDLSDAGLLAAIEAGRALGYRLGVLQASTDGLPVYRRIGFRAMFDYAVYQA
ncbi:MAG: hypothetical protein HYX55_00605 [Chloroflexi bacterium]|nr:hypothetical protein [Chloroflexota bacterium]